MSAIDYDAIETAIATHLTGKLSSTIYFVTQDFSAALNHTKAPVSVCVLYSGFNHQSALGQTNTPTRDMNVLIGVVARGESDRQQSQRLNDASSVIEDACNSPGNATAGNIFDYDTTPLELCFVVSAGPKTVLESKGLTMPIILSIRIMEE